VVTRKPNLLKTAATWITRLDKTDNAGAQVRVYRLRYGDARQVSKVLNDLFGTRSSGLDSAVNQLAPGGGVATTSSLTGGAGGTSPFGQTGGGLGGGAAAAASVRPSAAPPASAATTSRAASAAAQPSALRAASARRRGASAVAPAASAGTPAASAASAVPAAERAWASAGGLGGANQTTAISLPGVRIAADVVNNSLVIFANQENYRLIESTLAQLDRPQLQVAIHATIAEVTLNNDLQYGVEYYIQGNSAAFGLTTGIAQTALSAVLPAPIFCSGRRPIRASSSMHYATSPT